MPGVRDRLCLCVSVCSQLPPDLNAWIVLNRFGATLLRRSIPRCQSSLLANYHGPRVDGTTGSAFERASTGESRGKSVNQFIMVLFLCHKLITVVSKLGGSR